MHEKCDNYACPHCQKYFTDKNKIGRHIEQLQAKERFYCNECAENSTGRDWSSDHMVKHEEARDFKCEASGPGKADIERASKKLEP